MAEIAYQDFDLSLDRTPEGFRATVRASPAGSASADFVLPFSPVKLENYILRLGHVRRGVRRIETPETQGAREFGGALFQAIFTGELRACLRSSLDDTRRCGEGLRLRLRLNDPELWTLPWEYLYYPTRNQFLALSVHSPLVRYIELPEPVPVLAVDPPLRVLAMIASPVDHPPLDVEREWRLLNDAVGTLHPARRVVLERLQEPTLSALQRRLRRQDYHVFHFIGHGGYDQDKDEGVLLLEDENRKGDVVSSRHLGMLLHDHRPLRVAVLNACEGARSSLVDPFAGSAQTLVQQGLPAVIAMQFEIGDEVATTFAQELYGALSDGYPIDAAVTESRKAIFTSGHEVAWGTPVLYMRTPDGRIFDVKGTGHPVPGLGATSEEAVRPKARVAGAGAMGFLAPPTPDAGGDWGSVSSDELIVVPPSNAAEESTAIDESAPVEHEPERKRLSEAITLEKLAREPEPVEPVSALLDRAREQASQGRPGEALHLVGLALAREPGSIDARVLKRHLLHAMGTSSSLRPLGGLTGALRLLARPAAGILAVAILGTLAFALATWRARPEPPLAQQQQQRPQSPTTTVARHEPAAVPPSKRLDPPASTTETKPPSTVHRPPRTNRPTSSPATQPPTTTSTALPTTTTATPPATMPATATETATPTTAAGTLVFDVPAGSEIAIDGNVVGRAPMAGVDVAAGAHEFAVRHPDLGVWRRTISASPGQRIRVSVSEAAMRDAHGAAQERLARRALTESHRERSLAIVNAALQVAPTHQGLHDLLAQLVRDGLNQTIAARRAAEQAGRAARRSQAFDLGDAHFERAERLQNGGRIADAIPAYWAAQAQFERAVREAK
jgi:hypothetical protein